MSTQEPSTPKWLQLLRQNLSPLVISVPTGGSKSTLTEYIDENGKLLSALGLFLGLSVIANNLADKEMARFLSFLLFTLGLLVFFELMRNFRDFDYYGKIFWFRVVLTLSMFAFIYMYVKTYYTFLLEYLSLAAALFGVLGAFVIFQALIRWVLRMSWFRSLNPRARDFFIPVFGAMSLMTVCGFFIVLFHFRHKP
jgi:hypothetical protein